MNALSEEQLKRGEIYPRVNQIRDISVEVASAVMAQAVKEGREGRGGKISEILAVDGKTGIEKYVRSSMYYPEYRPTVFAPGGGKGTAD